MKDNDIIKAWEYCTSERTNSCFKCPFYKLCDDDNFFLVKATLNLINRQKAEIERLTKQTELDDKYIKSLEKAFNDRTAELQTAKLDIKQLHTDVERIDSRRIKDCRYWQSKYSSLRAEAVKEFAERLKDYYTKKKIYDRPNAHTLIGFLFSLIDDIAEEMVGAESGN